VLNASEEWTALRNWGSLKTATRVYCALTTINFVSNRCQAKRTSWSQPSRKAARVATEYLEHARHAQGRILMKQRTQLLAAQGRMIGPPPEPDEIPVIDPAPKATPLTPPDALYHQMLEKFLPVENVAEPAVVSTPNELSETFRQEHDLTSPYLIGPAPPGYNVNKYRKEINMGIKHAHSIRGFSPAGDRNDLKQCIDIEIWRATLKYLDGMNEKLAYTIAKFQTNKFLNKGWKDQTTAVITTELVLDKSGNPILKRNGQPKRKRVPWKDEFGKERRVYNASFDAQFNPNSTDEDANMMSGAEREVVMSAPSPEPDDPRLDKLTSSLPLLRRLVAGWFGAKRIVGEVLLKTPDATVRDFPGVPKSTACRVRSVVLAEFRALQESVVA
jgi:hypothetical protein